MKIFTILVLSTLIANAISPCPDHCSTCINENGNDVCTLCDVKNNYYLTNAGTCTLQSKPSNCLISGRMNNCLVCDGQRWLDLNIGGCVSANSISGCAEYENVSTCRECATGFYLNNFSTCTSASGITNCDVYASATTCLYCNSNRVPSIDGTTCEAVLQKDDCSKYSYLECERCKDEKNVNAYILRTFETPNTNLLLDSVRNLNDPREELDVDTVCFKHDILHCRTYANYNTCAECEPFFYLSNNECLPNPGQAVLFCVLFNSETSCFRCKNGYYISNFDTSVCHQSTFVQNCAIYDWDSDSCVRCNETHILIGGNQCVNRTMIPDCVTHHPTTDTCETCDISKVLINQNQNCEDQITFCDIYELNNAKDTPEACELCDSGRYFNGSVCVQGSVPQCDRYFNNGSCRECNLHYYLNNGSCLSRSFPYLECSLFDSLTLDTGCATCENDAFKFDVVEGCAVLMTINFCDVFSAYNVCSRCQPGYNLSNNQCNPNNQGDTCSVRINGQCVRCLDNYELYSNGTCLPLLARDVANCTQGDASAEGVNYTCQYCDAGYVPFNFDNNQFNTCIVRANYFGASIANCAVHRTDGFGQYCTACEGGFELRSDGTCGSCEPGEIPYLGYIDTSVNPHRYFESRCATNVTGQANCARQAASLYRFSTTSALCIECNSNSVPMRATCHIDRSYFGLIISPASNVAQAFAGVTCEATVVNASFFPSNRTSCKRWRRVGSNYYCRECLFGITGQVLSFNTNTYVNCNQSVQGCLTSVLNGTGEERSDSFMNNMYGFSLSENFTCHACSNASEIPFLHLTFNNGLGTYGIESGRRPDQAINPNGHLVACRAPTAATFFLNQNNFNFPSNCGLGLVVIDDDLSANYTNGSIRCLACKDGYEPLYNLDNTYITSCNAINRCSPDNVGGIFNSCANCSAGSSHRLSTAGFNNLDVIDYNSCVNNNVEPLCAISDNNDDCIACRPNSTWNHHGRCEALSVGCSYMGPNSLPNIPSLGFNVSVQDLLSTKYYYEGVGYGCTNCGGNEISIRIPNSIMNLENNVCVGSPDLLNGADNPLNQFIDNCTNYTLDLPLRCSQCASGFVVNSSGTACLDDANLNFCVVANSLNFCQTCMNNYQAVSGNCVLENIPGCASFSNNGSIVLCTGCQDGLRLQNNACSQGGVANCAQYDNLGDCIECMNGYFLRNNFCRILSNELNCLRGLATGILLDQFVCTTCASGTMLTTDSTAHQLDLCQVTMFPMVGCDVYNMDSQRCTLCLDTYYMDNSNVCQFRNQLDANCQTYNLRSEGCNICNGGYRNDNGVCILREYNTDCFAYTDATTCKYCFNDTIINDVTNACDPVANKIDNCKIYRWESGQLKCRTCEDNFILHNNFNDCRLIEVSNCSSVLSYNICSICEPSYQRRFLQNLIDCHPLTHSDNANPGTPGVDAEKNLQNTQNCVSWKENEYDCLACNNGMYPTGSNCNSFTLANPSPEPNCEVFNVSVTCILCKFNYVLDLSTNLCILDTDAYDRNPECEKLVYNENPECTACNENFYFDSGNCVTCNTMGNEHCSFCDSADTSFCLLCNTGYTMVTPGSCTLSPVEGGPNERRLLETNNTRRGLFETVGNVLKSLAL